MYFGANPTDLDVLSISTKVTDLQKKADAITAQNAAAEQTAITNRKNKLSAFIPQLNLIINNPVFAAIKTEAIQLVALINGFLATSTATPAPTGKDGLRGFGAMAMADDGDRLINAVDAFIKKANSLPAINVKPPIGIDRAFPKTDPIEFKKDNDKDNDRPVTNTPKTTTPPSLTEEAGFGSYLLGGILLFTGLSLFKGKKKK